MKVKAVLPSKSEKSATVILFLLALREFKLFKSVKWPGNSSPILLLSKILDTNFILILLFMNNIIVSLYILCDQ